jgi:HEPN domain-containing protein
MSDSPAPAAWFAYARENLNAARTLLDAGWLNTSLQNSQQAVEKALKSVLLGRELAVKRTHNVRELVTDLRRAGLDLGMTDDECDLIDSVYLPSKYPPVSALPDAMPDAETAGRCVRIAESVIQRAASLAGV